MYVGISGYFSVPLPDRISLAYQLRSEIRTQKSSNSYPGVERGIEGMRESPLNYSIFKTDQR